MRSCFLVYAFLDYYVLHRNKNVCTSGRVCYCITQHLHFGFFFSTTCSTWEGSFPFITVPLWTSTLGGTAFFSLHVPFAFVGVDVTGCWSCLPSVLWSGNSGDVALVGVGVIGLPSLISSTIWSASLDKSPSGLKGLSQPSELICVWTWPFDLCSIGLEVVIVLSPNISNDLGGEGSTHGFSDSKKLTRTLVDATVRYGRRGFFRWRYPAVVVSICADRRRGCDRWTKAQNAKDEKRSQIIFKIGRAHV